MKKSSWVIAVSACMTLAYAVGVAHIPVSDPSGSVACGDSDEEKKKKSDKDEDKS